MSMANDGPAGLALDCEAGHSDTTRRVFYSITAFSAIVLAFALRAYDLGGQSFWGDEGYTLLSTDQAGWDIPTAMPFGTFSLYYHLVHSSAQLAGWSEYAIRFPSLLAGVALVSVAFALGRRLRGTNVGLAAAYLAAISPPLIDQSRNARPYALVTLLLALNLYAILWIVGDAQASHWWVVATATLIAAAYSHLYALTALPAMVIALAWTAWKYRHLRWRFAVSLLAIGSSLAPWVARSFTATYAHVAARSANEPLSPLWFADAVLEGLAFGENSDFETRSRAILGATILLGILIGAFVLWRHSKGTSAIATVYLLVPTIAGYVLYLSVPYFAGRYLTFLAPVLYTVIAGSIAAQKRLRAAVLAIPLLVLAFGWMPQVYQQVFAASHERLDSLAADIRQRAQAGDIVASNSAWRQMILSYYLQGLDLPVILIPQEQPSTIDKVRNQITDATLGRSRVWVAFFGASPENPTQAIEPTLSQDFARVSNSWYGSTRLALYEQPPKIPGERHSPNIVFGDALELLDYELPPVRLVEPGGSALVRLRWLLRRSGDYAVSLRLVDQKGQVWAQVDDRPHNGYLSTSAMPELAEIAEARGLSIPWATPPGVYDLRIAVYDTQTGTEQGAQDIRAEAIPQTWALGRIEVAPAKVAPPLVLLPIENRTLENLGSLRLLGGSWPERVSAGQELRLELFWQAQGPLPVQDFVDIRLADDRGQVWGNVREPLKAYTSPGWVPGEVRRGKYGLRVLPTAPSGRYRMQVQALREAPQGTWLNESIVVALGSIDIESRTRQFSVPSMQRASGEVFGKIIELLGYDLANTHTLGGNVFEAKAGDQVLVSLHWRASVAIDALGVDRNYTVFVQVLDAKGRLVAQHDGSPAQGTAPTTTWVPGEVVQDPHILSLPSDLPPGVYSVIAGLYDSITMTRLRGEGNDHFVLGELLISEQQPQTKATHLIRDSQ